MRKITEESVMHFENGTSFKKSNMEIEVLPTMTVMMLFGKRIAFKHHLTNKLEITTCGWKTVTTKERLNGIRGVNIYQRKGIWYLNGEEWNGERIEVPR